jgi:hypothetical protein
MDSEQAQSPIIARGQTSPAKNYTLAYMVKHDICALDDRSIFEGIYRNRKER